MNENPHPSARNPSIFISYRRADTEGHAGRLSDSLKEHFGGRVHVFMDFEAIPVGEDFVKVIQDAVGSCNALVALIGSQWLTVTDAKSGKRRIDNERDHVRAEIVSALRRNIRVIPVLVQGAVMPSEEDLPDDLKPLAYRNALEVSSKRWDYDVRTLISALESSLPARARLLKWVAGLPRSAAVIGVIVVAALSLFVAQQIRTAYFQPAPTPTPTPANGNAAANANGEPAPSPQPSNANAPTPGGEKLANANANANTNAGVNTNANANDGRRGGNDAGGDDLMALSSVISDLNPAVVRIGVVSADGAQFYSTGFIVTRAGHILTADYVAGQRPGGGGAARYSVKLRDGGEHAASLVNVSADAGLAILKIEPGSYKTIGFADADPAAKGRVVVLGAIGGGEVIPVFGTVRGKSGRFIEVVYDVSGGAAGGGGGPVLNTRGEAVGVSHSSNMTLRQCIPGSAARSYLRSQGITQ